MDKFGRVDTFSNRVNKSLEARGITKEELFNSIIDVPNDELQKQFEIYQGDIDVSMIMTFASALNVSIRYLLGLDVPMGEYDY